MTKPYTDNTEFKIIYYKSCFGNMCIYCENQKYYDSMAELVGHIELKHKDKLK